MNKYDLVLFDMDGTIANTDELVVTSMEYFYKKYGHGYIRPREETIYFSGPPMKETMKKEFPDYDTDMLTKEFVEVSTPLYEQLVTSYPNCRHVLLKLKEQGIKLGVVTNKAHGPALICLDVIGLENIFDLLIGSDDVKTLKPSNEGILKAMSIFGIKDKDRVLYVGDNPIDYDTAVNSGVDSCLVMWGPRKMDPRVSSKHKIYKYSDLLEVVLDEK